MRTVASLVEVNVAQTRIVAKEIPVCARMTVVLDNVLVVRGKHALELILAINIKLMVASASRIPSKMKITVLNVKGKIQTFCLYKGLNI